MAMGENGVRSGGGWGVCLLRSLTSGLDGSRVLVGEGVVLQKQPRHRSSKKISDYN